MARRTERAALQLSESDREMLTTLSRSATAPVREATRAKVLLRYAAGLSLTQIRREVDVSRPTIYKCIDKALAAGVGAGLRDRYHRPRQRPTVHPGRQHPVRPVPRVALAGAVAARLAAIS